MNIEILKSKFDDLFENTSEAIEHYANRGYWITKETNNNSVMYIGLNPSYPHQDYQMSERLFYDEYQQTCYAYFKQIERFHDKLEYDVSWTHYDLLILRETKQSVIKKLSRKPDVREFIKKNLELSKYVIENSNPKIIVVANTFSRELLIGSEWCGYSLYWDDIVGTFRFSKGTLLSDTPVFFSSMLSGQRALDRGSRDRLLWQIQKTLEITEEKSKAQQAIMK
ncbi:hypothetical protein [Sunxiuqinia elliptica]|uniref:Uncharacterized protein n=1 Tax=Sunxiuqinia elliptica TaxID=655355 RepID=A0A1I2IX46_9BACT|nr:hypothetical protein [Sunxiuqinia elliptica]SFF46985.1 hypothetical protein SAMN05216283_10746 [Sunxiuqinia elliptica]